MATRTLDIFAAFQKLRAADVNDLPRGVFGKSDDVVSAQTGIGTSGALITGLEVTVVIPADRLIKVEARVQWEETSSGDNVGQVLTEIREGGSTLTREQRSYVQSSVTVRDTHHPVVWLDGPSAGSHTYTVFLQPVGSGAVLATEPAAGYPLQLIVEDCGPALSSGGGG